MEHVLYDNFGLKGNLNVLTPHIQGCMYIQVQEYQ